MNQYTQFSTISSSSLSIMLASLSWYQSHKYGSFIFFLIIKSNSSICGSKSSIILFPWSFGLIPQHIIDCSLTTMAMNLPTYCINPTFFVKLDKSNYLIWREQLKQVILIFGLHSLIDPDTIIP